MQELNQPPASLMPRFFGAELVCFAGMVKPGTLRWSGFPGRSESALLLMVLLGLLFAWPFALSRPLSSREAFAWFFGLWALACAALFLLSRARKAGGVD